MVSVAALCGWGADVPPGTITQAASAAGRASFRGARGSPRDLADAVWRALAGRQASAAGHGAGGALPGCRWCWPATRSSSSLKEPLVFTDLPFLSCAFRHPRLYVPVPGRFAHRPVGRHTGRVGGGRVVPGAALAGTGRLARVPALAAALGVPAGVLLWAGTRLCDAPTLDPAVDLQRWGLATSLWLYRRAERRRILEAPRSPFEPADAGARDHGAAGHRRGPERVVLRCPPGVPRRAGGRARALRRLTRSRRWPRAGCAFPPGVPTPCAPSSRSSRGWRARASAWTA